VRYGLASWDGFARMLQENYENMTNRREKICISIKRVIVRRDDLYHRWQPTLGRQDHLQDVKYAKRNVIDE
jgi:hypothetical protein